MDELPVESPRLLFLREQFAWMGKYSGYDRAFDEAEALWPGPTDSVYRTRSELQNVAYAPAAFLSSPPSLHPLRERDAEQIGQFDHALLEDLGGGQPDGA